MGMRNAECGIDFTDEQLMTEDVEDLEGAGAVDDEFAIADEGKFFILNLIIVAIGTKHHLETTLIVGGFGREGVARGGEEVGVGAGEIVN